MAHGFNNEDLDIYNVTSFVFIMLVILIKVHCHAPVFQTATY